VLKTDRRVAACGLAAATIAWLWATCAPCRAAAQHAAGGLAAAAAQFVSESERRDPLFADQIGIHAREDTLADYSLAGQAARARWLRAWRARIAELARRSQSKGDRADASALLDTIDLELFEDATVRPQRTDPTYYTGVIGNAVYLLVGRHYAPPDDRLRHIAPRLRQVPAIVAAAEASLERPTRVATLQAIDENAGNLALYASLIRETRVAKPSTQRAVEAALPAALASLRAFSRYLTTQLLPRSDRSPRVGAAVFDRELLLADGTTESRAALVAAARDDFNRNRAEMLRLALPYDRQFFPQRIRDEDRSDAVDVVVRRVLDRLANDHPTRSTILQTARTDVAESEAFLGAHPVVVLPQPPTLQVVPTPAFMAGFSGASLDPAGPFTPLAESYYYIDDIPATWTAAHVASYLRDFNDYEMRLLSIHEAVPGHYVQFRYNDAVPSLVRRVYANGSFAEGWAVYGEGMMLDAGYGSNDPRLRLFQLKWRLREEANAIIDAAYHTGDLTEARCKDLLERQAYQESSEADEKWHRLALSHDQLSSYFVGLQAIRRAEAYERTRLGSTFDVASFNAALLAIGSVEPRFIVPLIDAELLPAR
jgi:uncharacterized protein (DUF885 family)